MKKYLMSIITAGVVLYGMSSCEKSELRATEFDLPTTQSFVRFVFLSPGTPTVMIKVNNNKINGNNTSGTAGMFPPNFNIAEYAAVPPNGNLRLSLANTGTINDSVVVFTGNMTTSSGKFYTTVLADSGATRSLFSVADEFGNRVDSGFTRLRFINATGKSPALSLIRVDSSSASVVTRDTLFRNVTFTQATNYITVPTNPVNAFLRYRLVQSSNGAFVGAPFTPLVGNASNRRAITVISGGIWGTTFAPGISFQIVNQ
ncbi:MAG: DUF4397 domain-containing protein [Hydrotalea sp.]|nr:DUF4397 domain-containing protein [Hydrotalea sp.]